MNSADFTGIYDELSQAMQCLSTFARVGILILVTLTTDSLSVINHISVFWERSEMIIPDFGIKKNGWA